jgi:hypothetical protein
MKVAVQIYHTPTQSARVFLFFVCLSCLRNKWNFRYFRIQRAAGILSRFFVYDLFFSGLDFVILSFFGEGSIFCMLLRFFFALRLMIRLTRTTLPASVFDPG